MQWGIGLGKALDSRQVPRAAVRAEELGYDEAWISNERFHRDMFVVMGAAAALTRSLRLGTFVADPFTVHPAVTAAAIATVDSLSEGRAILGLGAGGTGFSQIGLRPRRPVASMSTALEAVKGLLRGERVTADDAHFEMHDAVLELSPAGDVPVVLASQSPKMLALGGRAADQVMISTFADPRLFGLAVGWAGDGAAEAGRELDVAEQVIARIDVAIDDDLDRARDALRPLIGYLLVLLHPNWFFLDTLELRLPDELHEIARNRDFVGMRARLGLIPEELIEAFGWVGGPTRVAEQIGRLLELGVRRVVVLPHSPDGDPIPTMEAFASRVMPLVERSL